ncbi:MAG: hypothetical protein ACREE0_15330 [Phenylobacterium sp.]
MSFLSATAAKLGTLLIGLLAIDLRVPVQVSPSVAVQDARVRAAAQRAQALTARKACQPSPVESDQTVRVGFILHSADLTEAGRTALSEAAVRLACAPDWTAEVVSRGDLHRLAGYRREIAERRADVITAYFRDHGVSDDRVARARSDMGEDGKTGRILLIEAVGPDA